MPDFTHLGRKLCHWCRGWYSPDAFTRDRSRPDGLDVHCRVCRRDIRQLPRTGTGKTRGTFTHAESLAIAWRYYHGENYCSLARELGVDSATVRRACIRARLDERRYRLFRVHSSAWFDLRRGDDSPASAHRDQPVSNRRVGEIPSGSSNLRPLGQGELFG